GSGATGSEAENTAATNVVYTATASDPDTVGTVAFSLSGADAAQFSIDSATGAVRFLDRTSDVEGEGADGGSAHQSVVQAKDGEHNTRQAVTLTESGTNDVAPTIGSGATGSEAENTAATNVVYTATASDPDTVGTVAFSLSGADAAQFSIVSATGAVRF